MVCGYLSPWIVKLPLDVMGMTGEGSSADEGSARAGAAMRSQATLVGGLVAPRLKMVAASSWPTEEALGMGKVPDQCARGGPVRG